MPRNLLYNTNKPAKPSTSKPNNQTKETTKQQILQTSTPNNNYKTTINKTNNYKRLTIFITNTITTTNQTTHQNQIHKATESKHKIYKTKTKYQQQL